MPQNPVLAGDVLAAGLRNTFEDAYRQAAVEMSTALPKVMDLGLPSDKLTEPYAYFETAPYPVRWPRGEALKSKGFKDVGWTTTNYDWANKVEWHENDRNDDQTSSLYAQAAMAGEHFATLPERVFFQVVNASTDLDLLPAIPNAPDGSALHAATRFGVSTQGRPAVFHVLLIGLGKSTRGFHSVFTPLAALLVTDLVEWRQHVLGELGTLFHNSVHEVFSSLFIAGQSLEELFRLQ